MPSRGRKSIFLLSGFSAIAMAVMLGLGGWQIERLAWKNDLIATVESRIDSPPVPLADILGDAGTARDIRYLPISAIGEFDLDQEIYVYTFLERGVGWLVFSPFVTDQGVLIVNRGFVLEANRNPASRPNAGGRTPVRMTITGLARMPENQVMFVPDNDRSANNWYWRDINAMAAAFDIAPERVVPFFLDLQSPEPPGGLPQVGVTRVEFTNRHLGYAITWFGLAAAFVIIFLVFVRRQVKQAP